jgi:hypothetical protein
VSEFLNSTWLLLPGIALVAAVLHALVRRARRERRQRREHGWRLIHELKAYSAWVDSLHGEPFMSTEPEELTSAQALTRARAIAHEHFPQLGQAMLRLLQVDSQLTRHLWEHKLRRLSGPGDGVPCQRDPEYRELRDAQEDLIDSIIARCQALIGDSGRRWRHTGMDSEFFASMGISSGTCR